MRFPLISIGNSNNMILEASKSAVLGFGKRRAGKDGESKAQAFLAERTAPQILAITVPLATAATSIAWAIAVYLMVRERYRTQVEIARVAAEASGQRTIPEESPLLMQGDHSL
jgi:hypothetical protein